MKQTTDPMLATIIIDNYNYGRFLQDAIDSALNQTYPRTEVIVVDDGSTDNSRDIIAAYGDRVIPVLKENGGQASAFNAGHAVSHGEVVIFLDADDMLLPTAVERAVESFSDPTVVKVQWQLHEIDEGGARTGNLIPDRNLTSGDLREAVVKNGPLSHANAPTSGNAWARRFLDQVFPVLEPGDKHGADAYLLTLAWVLGSARTVDRPQGCYRKHSGNFSGDGAQMELKRHIRRYDQHCRVLTEHLRRLGISVDSARWKGPGTGYAWMEEMLLVPDEIAAVIPEGQMFILVDEDQLGSQFVEGRQGVPFLERGGQYWGPPPDDSTAIQELERMRGLGASYIVFVRSTLWWLEFYTGLRDYLSRKFPRALGTDRLVIFDLR